MMPNTTSIGYKNMPESQVGDFLLQLPGMRHLSEVPWGAKGESRLRSVARFGRVTVNYFAGNVRNGPMLLVQGRRDLIPQVAQELRRFWERPRGEKFYRLPHIAFIW